jgi:hypothetical protein
MNRLRVFGFIFSLLFSFSALATEALPNCMVGNKILLVNNAQISNWKRTTANQFLGRGHVRGRLSRVYPAKNRHAHFQIEFAGAARDTLEIVYNLDFGPLPQLAVGMEVEACGDYITSNAPTSKYPASPDGAIIHWVHRTTGKHPSGYVALDGRVFGGATLRSFEVPAYSFSH